jgi:D-aspartate ligase
MNIQDTQTSVVILNCKLGGLSIMRSLGSQGIALAGVDSDGSAPGFQSRYCQKKFIKSFHGSSREEYLSYLLQVGKRLGKKSVLIPTSDDLAVFVAEYASELSAYFIFAKNDPALVRTLISKQGMYELARKHGIPTAFTVFPRSIYDVVTYAQGASYPVMLKGIDGNRLHARTGKKMIIVNSKDELIRNYTALEEPHSPNLMIQDYIPGGDDQIYIFNGYFNERSECLAAFTGHKIRQYPVHVGCASLGVCTWNIEVAEMTTEFMKAIGYRGILDIGYRLDHRDGKYKVLDINPRIGQAFRLFLAEDGLDVAMALYMDLTGQQIATVVPKEGRRWIIEDYDLESSLKYHKEGILTFRGWVKSFKGIEEAAWFNWKDPFPFLVMCSGLVKKVFLSFWKKVRNLKKQKDPGIKITDA